MEEDEKESLPLSSFPRTRWLIKRLSSPGGIEFDSCLKNDTSPSSKRSDSNNSNNNNIENKDTSSHDRQYREEKEKYSYTDKRDREADLEMYETRLTEIAARLEIEGNANAAHSEAILSCAAQLQSRVDDLQSVEDGLHNKMDTLKALLSRTTTLSKRVIENNKDIKDMTVSINKQEEYTSTLIRNINSMNTKFRQREQERELKCSDYKKLIDSWSEQAKKLKDVLEKTESVGKTVNIKLMEVSTLTETLEKSIKDVEKVRSENEERTQKLLDIEEKLTKRQVKIEKWEENISGCVNAIAKELDAMEKEKEKLLREALRVKAESEEVVKMKKELVSTQKSLEEFSELIVQRYKALKEREMKVAEAERLIQQQCNFVSPK